MAYCSASSCRQAIRLKGAQVNELLKKSQRESKPGSRRVLAWRLCPLSLLSMLNFPIRR